MEWGVGEKNVEQETKDKQMLEDEAGRGYHGYWKDDPKLNQERKEEIRFGDPMANKLTKKALPKNLKIYTRSFPPNRFNIRPGWRWDGVDRSNKYEQELFRLQNEKAARKEEQMYWAQADM